MTRPARVDVLPTASDVETKLITKLLNEFIDEFSILTEDNDKHKNIFRTPYDIVRFLHYLYVNGNGDLISKIRCYIYYGYNSTFSMIPWLLEIDEDEAAIKDTVTWHFSGYGRSMNLIIYIPLNESQSCYVKLMNGTVFNSKDLGEILKTTDYSISGTLREQELSNIVSSFIFRGFNTIERFVK